MISDNQSICPKCGGQLKYYDHVQRLVRTKFGNKKWVAIRRLRCCKCHAVHRELPDFIFPYKQYEADIIIGVLEGLITCETLGFEDYPCEMTMIRWRLFPPRLFLLKAVPNLASTVVGVMLGYFFKALFETFFEKREERLKQESEPEENTNYEEV